MSLLYFPTVGRIKQQPMDKHEACDGMCYYQDVSIIPNSHGSVRSRLYSMSSWILALTEGAIWTL